VQAGDVRVCWLTFQLFPGLTRWPVKARRSLSAASFPCGVASAFPEGRFYCLVNIRGGCLGAEVASRDESLGNCLIAEYTRRTEFFHWDRNNRDTGLAVRGRFGSGPVLALPRENDFDLGTVVDLDGPGGVSGRSAGEVPGV